MPDNSKHIIVNMIIISVLLTVIGVTMSMPVQLLIKLGIVGFSLIAVFIYCIILADKISENKEKEAYYRNQQTRSELALIIAAIRTYYPFVMFSNLTQDTCRIEYNDTEGRDNESATKVDAMLDLVLNTIPEPIHRAEFQRKFTREALLKAYEEGQTMVKCTIKQKLKEEIHWMDTTVILYKSDDGDIHTVSLTRNIDEDIQKAYEFEEALSGAEAADKVKTSFLTSMSHEIRTPINAVLGMNTMILREAKEENVKGYAKNIQTAANTLLSLMNDILDYAKIESGKMEVVPAQYDLGPVINDVLGVIQLKANEKELEFKTQIDGETPALLIGDAIRIKQILLNILKNAVKYTEKGSITFKLGYDIITKDRIDLIISISDTGVGIKPESLRAIFSPYFRLEENRNRNMEGTGLGLSITQDLLARMGSKLEIDSTFGVGSTFSFRIEQKIWGEGTLAGTEERLAKHDAPDEMENFHIPDAKILVIDDVEMNIVVVRSLLKRIGANIDSALNGEDGIELAKKNKYDIIFIDAMMPKMNGTETMLNIRNDSTLNADTPMVVLTANAVQGAKDEYLREGFTDYLAKPVEGKLLEAMIKRYVNPQLIVPAGAEEEEEQSDFEGELAAIAKIPGINCKLGIEASASEEIYKKVCSMFYDSGLERIKMIEDYFEAMDIQNYTIQVHALKSSARLLGAMDFSDAAKALEMAGHENDISTIKRDTPLLIQEYRRIYEALGNVYGSSEEDDEREEIPLDELKGMLAEMKEALEAFDHDTSGMIMDALEEYRLPEDFKNNFTKLKTGRAEVDRDGMIREIDDYLQRG